MKSVIRLFVLLCIAPCILLCAFTFDSDSSLKELTLPYINTYECIRATLGGQDLLDDFEYLTITLEDSNSLEVSFKKKDGRRHSYSCNYTVDEQSGELRAELGIMGFRFRQKTKIENGSFTLCMTLLNRPLVMAFKAK